MNETDVTKDGQRHVRPGREATTGVHTGPGVEHVPSAARPARGRGEQAMVPAAEFGSYYGKPIINQPVWESPDIPGYLFLGGLAGSSAVIAAGAQVTGRRGLARVAKVGAAASAALSTVALVHDLGRRGRFLNMLRTFKPTSPMSVGSWILASFGPAAAVAAGSDLTGVAPGIGAAATVGAAVLGPPLATYTAALISDTAVPAWHDAHRDMPFVFAASAVTSAAGLGMLGAPVEERGPVRLLGALGGAAELATERLMEARMGLAREAFDEGRAARYHKGAQALLVAGTLSSLTARRSRFLGAVAGASLLAGSALTRFAIFEAGLASAKDPRYTVVPQRARLEARRTRPSEGPRSNGDHPAAPPTGTE
jgi:formate-dependent nitrite reductase membrane component NrfD